MIVSSLATRAIAKSPKTPPSPDRKGQPAGACSDAKKAGTKTSAQAQNTSLNLGLTQGIAG